MKYYVQCFGHFDASGGMNDMNGPYNSADEAAAYAQKTSELEDVELIKVENDTLDNVACWDTVDHCWCYYKEKT